jgi:Inner membrane protein YgaP-like, transmembrane domain
MQTPHNSSREVAMSLAQSFARTGFARFLNSRAGRIARIAAGIGLMIWGYTLHLQPVGIVLLVIGLVPLTAGTFDLCLVSALLGGPISGARVAASGKNPEAGSP